MKNTQTKKYNIFDIDEVLGMRYPVRKIEQSDLIRFGSQAESVKGTSQPPGLSGGE